MKISSERLRCAIADMDVVLRLGSIEQFHVELAAAYRDLVERPSHRTIGEGLHVREIARQLARLTGDTPEELQQHAERFKFGDDKTTIALRVLHDYAARLLAAQQKRRPIRTPPVGQTVSTMVDTSTPKGGRERRSA